MVQAHHRPERRTLISLAYRPTAIVAAATARWSSAVRRRQRRRPLPSRPARACARPPGGEARNSNRLLDRRS